MDPVGATGRGGANLKDSGHSTESGGGHRDSSSNPYHRCFSGVALKMTVVFVVGGLICLVIISQPAYPTSLFQRTDSFSGAKHGLSSCGCDINHGAMQQNVLPPFQGLPSAAKDETELLATTLRKAAMKDNKTVILTTLNAAWAEPNSMFDLFLESFRIGKGTQNLLKHVVVGAFDQKAYSRCRKENLHCFVLTTDGIDFSGEARFRSDDYLKMMWRRIDFLRAVLELGYDFVFTDADIMWLRDPFPKFYPDGDFQIACDRYRYNYTDLNNEANGGFNYVKSNNATIQFYKFWHTANYYFPGKHDQDVLNIIKYNPFIRGIGLKMRFFDTAYFSGFCEPSKDLDQVITVHANCCYSVKDKIHDVKMVIDDWKKYMALLGSGKKERNLSSRSWTVPRICH